MADHWAGQLADFHASFAKDYLQTPEGAWVELWRRHADLFAANGMHGVPLEDGDAAWLAATVFATVKRSLCMMSMDAHKQDMIIAGQQVELTYDLGDGQILTCHVNKQ